jgi:hypothetical protein
MKLYKLIQSLTILLALALSTCTSTSTEANIFISEKNLKKRKNLNKKPATYRLKQEEDNADHENVQLTAWVKYFKYDKDSLTPPSKFFVNNDYYQQKRLFPNADLNKTLTDGKATHHLFIRNYTDFYIMAFQKSINFLTSRQVK